MHTLYVDESGNAGSNYLDKEQPFVVYAGILIDDERVATVASKLRAHAGQASEVKASRIFRRKNGAARAAQLLTLLGANGCIPFYVIMDRKFSIAGKVVDIFLDPAHQPAVDWLPTSDMAQRHQITEVLYEQLGDHILERFAAAYAAPTIDSFTQVLVGVIQRLVGLGQIELVRAFEGALSAVDVIVKAETRSVFGVHKKLTALNIPACLHLLRLVDIAMDGRGKFCAVLDETPEFQSLLTTFIDALTAPDHPHPDLLLTCGTAFRGVMRNICSVRVDNSESTPLLQAADLLASSVARVAKAAVSGDDLGAAGMKGLARLTVPALLDVGDGSPAIARGYMAEVTMAAVVGAAL